MAPVERFFFELEKRLSFFKMSRLVEQCKDHHDRLPPIGDGRGQDAPSIKHLSRANGRGFAGMQSRIDLIGTRYTGRLFCILISIVSA